MNRKGISPIIAVLLLVIIAVAAAILTYLWVLGYIGTVQQQGGTEALQERLKIEGVDAAGGTLNAVYVRNIGDVQSEIDAIYLLNATGVIGVDWDIGETIPPGNLTRIDLVADQGTFDLSVGVTYIVKVVTRTGAEATYTFTYRE